MMTPEQIAAMRADAEAGTPGPWRLGSWLDCIFGTGPKDEWLSICRVKRDNAPIEESADIVDARRIARVPDMEATIIAQSAEIKRLKSCIPWRDGPPPAEWRDGRQVLVWADDASAMRWDDDIWNDGTWCIEDDQITHHAAVAKPGE